MEIFGLSVFAFVGIIFAFILLTIAVNLSDGDDEGNGIFSSLVVLGSIGMAYWIDSSIFKSVLTFIKEKTLFFIISIIVYFIIGLIWSVFKWWIFLRKEAQKYIKSQNFSSRPKPSDNSATITMWITYWPVSLFWFTVSNPFVKLGEFIGTYFTGIYERISKSVWDSATTQKQNKNPFS
jgi:hypothetical protein